MANLRLFGAPSYQYIKAVQEAAFHSGNIFMAIMDHAALWKPETLDIITAEFPKNLVEESDLYLVMVECIANAALHGNAEALGVYARVRGNILLITFLQEPPMAEIVSEVLQIVKRGALPDYACDLPGGLGFPILIKLANRITISPDRSKLQLWFRLKRRQSIFGFFYSLFVSKYEAAARR